MFFKMTSYCATQKFVYDISLRFLKVFRSDSFKMGQSQPLFVYFRSFLITISIQIEKSVDGVLGIRAQGQRMVGADKTMELWRPPFDQILMYYLEYHKSLHVKWLSS